MASIRKRLQEYLRERYPRRDELEIELADMPEGWETELKRVYMTWKLGNNRQEIQRVIRIYSSSEGEEKAEREFHLMRKLNKINYPVPEVYLIESTGEIIGNPFIIMDYIQGETLTRKITTSEDEDKSVEGMMELLVKLHEMDPRAIYPDTQLPTTQEALNRYFDYHQSFLEETGSTILKPVMNWLRERRDNITETKPSILHGDYHADNILVRDNEQFIVVDWGASKIGDPREDLSWTMLLHSIYGDLQGGPKILESYRNITHRTIEDIDYFIVLAVVRRMVDLLYSVFAGSETKGMRSETVELMKTHKEPYLKAYSILKKHTGLKIEELHSYLRKM